MTTVIWSLQAIDDLTQIRDYVRRDSPQYAALVVAEIVATIERLHTFPASGRLVPERAGSGLREVLWRSYRVVYAYQPTHDRVELLLVFRAERLFPAPRPLPGGEQPG